MYNMNIVLQVIANAYTNLVDTFTISECI